MQRIQIYPSILAADFSRLGDEIKTVEKAGADGIHFDVMDGHFVPNISFGTVVLRSIRKKTRLPFWVHLMITDPSRYAEEFIESGADGLFIHPETDDDITELAEKVTRLGAKCGMAVNPGTEIEEFEPLIPLFTDFLVMTVEPGFGGQQLIDESLKKVSIIKKISLNYNRTARVHVDGGVNEKTVKEVVLAGTDVLVAGSSVFGRSDPGKTLIQLRRSAERFAVNRDDETKHGV